MRKKTPGLPPGTLIHTGKRKKEVTNIEIIDYDEKNISEKQITNAEDAYNYKKKSSVTWINLDSVHDTEIIEGLGSHYGFHPLVMEDICSVNQRPKIEDYDGYVFVVMKMLYLKDKDIVSEQVSLVLGQNFVISFQEDSKDVFEPVRERLRKGKGRIRKKGSDYLTYALIDAVVDNYFVVLEKLGEQIIELEEEVLKDPDEKTLQKIQLIKREVIEIRKNVWPLREVISGMTRSGSKFISKDTELFLKDVYDHTVQVIDTIESNRDTLASVLDIYLSSLSNKMNEVMKVLTIIATIFIPLTFIAGIYGMNFQHMPELAMRNGYFYTLGAMGLIFIAMLFYFRKKKWL